MTTGADAAERDREQRTSAPQYAPAPPPTSSNVRPRPAAAASCASGAALPWASGESRGRVGGPHRPAPRPAQGRSGIADRAKRSLYPSIRLPPACKVCAPTPAGATRANVPMHPRRPFLARRHVVLSEQPPPRPSCPLALRAQAAAHHPQQTCRTTARESYTNVAQELSNTPSRMNTDAQDPPQCLPK